MTTFWKRKKYFVYDIWMELVKIDWWIRRNENTVKLMRCEHLGTRAKAFTLGLFTSQRSFHNVKDANGIRIFCSHFRGVQNERFHSKNSGLFLTTIHGITLYWKMCTLYLRALNTSRSYRSVSCSFTKPYHHVIPYSLLQYNTIQWHVRTCCILCHSIHPFPIPTIHFLTNTVPYDTIPL